MKLTPLAFILAAFVLGYVLGYSQPVPVDPNYVSPEYGELLEKYRAKVKECDSIDFARVQALEAKGLADSQVKELQEKLAAATEVKPETGIVTTLPVSGAACPTGNCQPGFQPATVE